jgi:hypothetical protein
VLLAVLVLVLVAAVLIVPTLVEVARTRAGVFRARRDARRRRRGIEPRDPGRERRAEQRARELLRSCVNGEEWAMYRDLGFIRVLPRSSGTHAISADLEIGTARDPEPGEGPPLEPGPSRLRADPPEERRAPRRGEPIDQREGDDRRTGRRRRGDPSYAYLIYPHKPIVAFVPETSRLLSEYCVEFPDLSGTVTGARLPDSDDVLAKWMALTGDEHRVIRTANMHLPGRQVDPSRVRRDLWRLSEWERRRGPRSAQPTDR